MSVDRISREISRIMASKPKKPQPYDTIGVVQGVRDGKAWVRFAGSDQETPVQMTIDAKEGDSVMVRVVGGRAFIIGNDTAPPTDDRAANEAHKTARMAYNSAKRASEEVEGMSEKVDEASEKAAQAMISADGKNTIYHSDTEPTGGTYKVGDTWFDSAHEYAINTWNGSQWVKEELGADALKDLAITNAKIANGTIQSAKIAGLDVGKLTGGYIDAGHINVSSLQIGIADVDGLEDALDDAGETSKYVTYIDSTNGVRVHKANDNSNYGQFNANGMQVYQGGNEVASFGATSQIGRNNSYHLLTTNTGYLQFWLNASQKAGSITFNSNQSIRVSSGGTYPAEVILTPYNASLTVTNQSTGDEHKLSVSDDGTLTFDTEEIVDKSMMATGTVASTSVSARSYKDFTISFGKTFSSAPIVTATLVSTSTAYQLGNVSVAVVSTSTTGATLRVFNADSTSRAPAINWIAIGI